jgi:hypothetical protein
MRRLRLAMTGFAVVVLLMVPRSASAGMGEVVDYILGLTGPAMIGLPIGCDLNLNSRESACNFSFIQLKGPDDDSFWLNRRFWVSLSGGIYASTAKDSEMREFSWFDVGMLALEPTLNYRTFTRGDDARYVIEHGAGGSLLYLFGDGFEPFAKGAIKIRPISFTARNVFNGRISLGVAYNLRIFPDAFTSEDFGAPPSSTHGGREVAHGFTIILGY